MYRGRRGMGRTVVVVSAPPPPPLAVVGVQITHFSESGDITLYHIKVFSVAGEQWEVAARFSAFEALKGNLRNAPIQTLFPGKKPLKSLFGLQDDVKNERRMELEHWLTTAITASHTLPWMRAHLNSFMRAPAHLLLALAPTAQAVPNSFAGGGGSRVGGGTIQVQMPSGVRVGELLEVEHHGEVFHVPAPSGVSAGTTFEVTLPEEEHSGGAPQVARPVGGSGGGGGHGYGTPVAMPTSAVVPEAAVPVAPSQPASIQQVLGGFTAPRQSSQTVLEVTVPPGMSAGQQLVVQTPSGQQMAILLPPGVVPGQKLQVQAPPPRPVMVVAATSMPPPQAYIEAQAAVQPTAVYKSSANPF